MCDTVMYRLRQEDLDRMKSALEGVQQVGQGSAVLGDEDVAVLEDVVMDLEILIGKMGPRETCPNCGASHRTHRRKVDALGNRCQNTWHRDRRPSAPREEIKLKDHRSVFRKLKSFFS